MKLLLSISLMMLCLASNGFAETAPNPKSLQKIDNSNYFIGDKNKAIATFLFKEFEKGQLDKQIVFFVDKFPYEEKFNLCDTYEKDIPQCDSHIKIQNITAQKAPYFTNFSFVFPQSLDLTNKKLFGSSPISAANFSVGNGEKLEITHDPSVSTFEFLNN